MSLTTADAAWIKNWIKKNLRLDIHMPGVGGDGSGITTLAAKDKKIGFMLVLDGQPFNVGFINAIDLWTLIDHNGGFTY